MSFSSPLPGSDLGGESTMHAQPHQEVFRCPQCPKSFNRNENLKRHAASHEGAGKYRCVVCAKRFTRSDLLKRHRRNHDKRTSVSVEPGQDQLQADVSFGGIASPSENQVPPIPAISEGIDNQGHYNSMQENPSGILFDSFMTNDDISGLNLGSFDADIGWTLDFAYSHPFMDSFPGEYLTPSSASFTGVASSRVLDEADDDADGEWPDRISRPASPKPLRSSNTQRAPVDWSATIAEAQLAKSQFEAKDTFAVSIDEGTRETLLNLLSLPSAQLNDSGLRIGAFPPTEVLEYFLVLYFRHIHERFPVIHLPTFHLLKLSPFLLMAMLLAGSSHSKTNKGWFLRVFYEHCQAALMRSIQRSSRFLRSVDNIFGLLLVCVAGTWSGGRESYEFAEGFRGVLVTASRRCRLLDCRSSPGESDTPKGSRVLDHIWYSWIEIERRKRLGLAIYLYDCQYPALFNNQAYVSKSETANSVFPCPQEYWDAKTSDTWKMLIGPANIPPSTFYIHALNSCLLPADAPSALRVDDFGRTVLLYAVHTHIFEWRQAISMINPNGFANMYGSLIVDIGEGLQVRKEWLVDSLNNWHKCYYNACVDPTIVLLYHLGFVSLDVSLSDLHLTAGRSGNRTEGEIAEKSLRSWANSEGAASTMSHVRQGFEVAYSVLDSGAMLRGSFEIIMTLFTGGLVSWAYSKFHRGDSQQVSVDHVRRAGVALRELASWRISSLFGAILKDFENVEKSI